MVEDPTMRIWSRACATETAETSTSDAAMAVEASVRRIRSPKMNLRIFKLILIRFEHPSFLCCSGGIRDRGSVCIFDHSDPVLARQIVIPVDAVQVAAFKKRLNVVGGQFERA